MNLEIRDLQRAIELLRCAINEKEFAMKIAQTRLDERTRRLCVEVCFDEPMKGSVRLCVRVSLCVSVCLSVCHMKQNESEKAVTCERAKEATEDEPQ